VAISEYLGDIVILGDPRVCVFEYGHLPEPARHCKALQAGMTNKGLI